MELSSRPRRHPPSHEAVPVAAYLNERFHTLVLQPTTLCNLDCAYCYLPERKSNRLMPVEVAAACARSIADQHGEEPVDVVWHGGEPTVTPVTHMRSLLEQFEQLRQVGLVRHGIQTNATLVDEAWCRLFTRFEVDVGVSIDGPAAANRHRVGWRGQQTWDRTIRGIRTLQDYQIELTAICVVSPETIDHPDVLADFFGQLGCASVGFNLEEQEGAGRPPLDETAAYRFWRRLWQRRAAGDQLRIRDLDRFASYITTARTHGRQHRRRRYEPIPTVAWDGRTVLLSPELLGVRSEKYDDFIAGNVLDTPIGTMLASAHKLRYVHELATALDSCARTCPLWDFCGGAQAGNRFFEAGTFTVSETAYCRNTKMALVRAAADQHQPQREEVPR